MKWGIACILYLFAVATISYRALEAGAAGNRDDNPFSDGLLKT